jgi:hypothetical protein
MGSITKEERNIRERDRLRAKRALLLPKLTEEEKRTKKVQQNKRKLEYNRARNNDPQVKYLKHKNNAAVRGVPFLFTFEEWWDIWQQSGKWEQRGKKKGQYVMSRYGDIGPYSIDNVFIQLAQYNIRDAQVERKNRNKKKREYNIDRQQENQLVSNILSDQIN